jgi:uncharacterized LabA/DUF88 family protein
MESDKIAIFVDYENIRKSLQVHLSHIADPGQIARTIKEAADEHGQVLMANVYGDWALPHPGPNGGRVFSAKHFVSAGYEPIMVPVKSSGQDRTDMWLALDAQKILFKNPEVTAFMIVSGDGDYGRLARELRSAQKRVMVCGIGVAISRELISLANPLITLENLLGLTPPPTVAKEPSLDSAASQFDWVTLIQTLERAEKQPWEFVGLKYFRDKWITSAMGVTDSNQAQNILNEGVAQEVIETYTVSNPKNHSFPTAAIKLNRAHPLVQATLQ